MNDVLFISNVHGYLDGDTGLAYLNAEDVARGLGIVQHKMLDGKECEFVRWERVNRYLHEFGFPHTVGNNDYIPENLVYRLGFKANNEVAQRFQEVVANEVLPAIRKHGAYMTQDALKKAIESPDFLIQLASKLKEEQQARAQAELVIEAQKPKVIFADAVSVSTDVMNIGELAKILFQNGVDIGRNRLMAWMRNHGYLIKGGRDNNTPTQRAMNLGLFKVKERTINCADGSVLLKRTSLVTGKGQQYFINKFIGKKELVN